LIDVVKIDEQVRIEDITMLQYWPQIDEMVRIEETVKTDEKVDRKQGVDCRSIKR